MMILGRLVTEIVTDHTLDRSAFVLFRKRVNYILGTSDGLIRVKTRPESWSWFGSCYNCTGVIAIYKFNSDFT